MKLISKSRIAENYFQLSQRFRWLSVVALSLLIFLSIHSAYSLIVHFKGVEMLPEYWLEIRSVLVRGLLLQLLLTLCLLLRFLMLISTKHKIKVSESLWLFSVSIALFWGFLSYIKNYDCFYSGTYSCADVSPNLFHYTTYEFQQALGIYCLVSIIFAILLLLIAFWQTVIQRYKISSKTERHNAEHDPDH